MKVLCCGGRHYRKREFVFAVLDAIAEQHGVELLIHGDAAGADSLAADWAVSRHVPVYAFPADWARYGRSAGPIRNRRMLEEEPDIVVAFHGGRGTQDMLRQARAAGIDTVEYMDESD